MFLYQIAGADKCQHVRFDAKVLYNFVSNNENRNFYESYQRGFDTESFHYMGMD